MSQPREFDVCGPLPSGVTVLEASAGTGKTYTIAALAARYVAEGIPLERMLLVTFTRMATGELRERVRDRLIEVERGLAARLAGTPSAGDPIVDLLFTGGAEVARRRLARAVAGFDSATIATTHGFCQEVLGGLGIAGDLEPDVTFVEDLSDLAADVVDDLYVRKFRRGDAPAFDLGQASQIARAAIDNPSAALVSATGPVPEMRTGLARAARQELERRKRAAGVMTYDDLVTRLQTALRGPAGEAARASLRWRFDVVLVDEFQDTDPAQWEIMREAFAGESAPTAPDARADRRSQAGDLRLPRRRRLRLPAGCQGRRRTGHPAGELALGSGPDRCPRRALLRRASRPRGDRLPAGARRARAPGVAPDGRARAGADALPRGDAREPRPRAHAAGLCQEGLGTAVHRR